MAFFNQLFNGAKNLFQSGNSGGAPQLTTYNSQAPLRPLPETTQPGFTSESSSGQFGGTASNAGGGGPGGGKAAAPSAPAAPAPPTNNNYTGNTINTNTGSTSTSGTASSSLTPGLNSNGGAADFLQTTFQPVLNQLQGAYYNLFGGNGQSGILPTAQGQAAANVQSGYNSQLGNLGQSFAQAQTQLPWEYAARGAANSGWAGNAYNTAQNEFNNSQNAIQQQEKSDIAKIYQQGAAQQGQTQQELSFFNNPQFQAMINQQSPLYQSEQFSELGQDLANLAYSTGSNTPISQAIAGINSNPTYQQQGSQQLQQQLQALASSGAPSAVQNQIAQGIIGNPTNPANSNLSNQWQQILQTPVNQTA